MRRVSSSTLLAAPLILVAGAAVPTATVDRYSFSYAATSVTDMSGFGQPNQEASLELGGALTMTIEETADGRTITVVLDSLSGTGSGPQWAMMRDSLPPAVGARWTGSFDEKGRVDLTADRDNGMVEQFEGTVLTYLFPAYTPGAKVGDSWVDTTDVSRTTSQGPQHTVTETTYTVAGPGTLHGIDYLRVEASFTSDITIQLESQGLETTGTSTGTGAYLMTGDGRSLGASREASVELVVEGAALPQPIPVSVTTTMTTEHLP